MDFIFGMVIGQGDQGGFFFCKSGSKVKVKNPQKCALSGLILVAACKCKVCKDRGRSGGVVLAVCHRTTGGIL